MLQNDFQLSVFPLTIPNLGTLLDYPQLNVQVCFQSIALLQKPGRVITYASTQVK